MAYQYLLCDRTDHVGTITLNRPDAFNAFNAEMGRELYRAVLELDEAPDVRCIVLAGAGKAFCGGGDVKEFVDALPRIGVHVKELTTYLHGAVSRLARSGKPVVSAVNGVVAGGGLGVALAGDVVVAAESARFTMAYSRIAASPDGGSSYLLPRLVGLRRAMELYFTNRVLSAREALDCIIQDGKRASDVIGRIRALIKKEPLRKDDVEINEAILEVIALTHGEAVKHGVSVQTQLAGGLPLIRGDRVQLQQVILNLILNAVQAMSGVTERTRELLIGTGQEASGAVLVTVQDSGPGFSPESFDRPFEPLYTTKTEGMGMGLSICRLIVDAHRGRIWALPTAGPSAVVQFTVPVG